MVITVKTKGKEIKALSGNCINHTAKKSCFSINAKDLPKVLAILYSEGYTKFKGDMDDNDKRELTIDFNTKSPMKYLEHMLAKDIEILEEDKDVLKFLETIKFPNEFIGNIKLIYDALTKNDIELRTTTKAHIYINACRKGFVDGEKDLKNVIREWVNEYHSDYIAHIGKSVPYDVFLKLLLKHTGHKY